STSCSLLKAECKKRRLILTTCTTWQSIR
ncbi:peptidase M9 N-terminal family protein, partial [Vibrio parahaemolyticus V-223/04]